MRLAAPIRYHICFNPREITSVAGPNGETKFVAPVSNPGRKLYVVCSEAMPIYIGATNQPIRNRLRLGFQAHGNNGYRGYIWRHYLTQAALDIWRVQVEQRDIDDMQNDPTIQQARGNIERQMDIVIETVEAEAAFLIRQEYGQWPRFQQEIHFHQSVGAPSRAAVEVVNHYRRP